MFKPISVEVTNSYDFPLEKHPFSIGVPCAEGALFEQKGLSLQHNGQSKAFHISPLAIWPDGSIKWFLLDFQASLKAGELSSLTLTKDDACEPSASAEVAELAINEGDDAYLIDTGVAQFTVSKHRLGLFEQVTHAEKPLLAEASSCIELTDASDNLASAIISSQHLSDTENTLRKKIHLAGFFQHDNGTSLADFQLTLTFFAGLATVKCDFTLSNPQAAEHPGGVWDLGDKGSFFFKQLAIKIPLVETAGAGNSAIRFSPDADWRQAEDLALEQNSSGGENWQSKNHMNFKQELAVEFKGYRYFEHGEQCANGDRATPSVYLATDTGGITAHLVDFWQNFPKSLMFEQSVLSLNLFPCLASDCYELQGGERKKHTFYLDFSGDKTSLDGHVEDIVPRLPLAHYAATKAIPWLPKLYQETDTQKLIDRGIRGEKNFFEKREAIDEFGWRNFGEIYADHEGFEYKGEGELISHYNNQYDPLYGFIKQYLMSGDKRWFDLLSPLAQHIIDIDIYHTVKDRDEYNGGLFWHTHHYLNAFTCTHRTFSQQHQSDFLYGDIGGGPGDEHCYTTGLSYYYYLTGDEAYKDAALQLTHWLTRVLEGAGTAIERVYQFKSKELPVLKRLLSGETVQRYRYPFTRGTGNYITALIDAFNLTGQRQYLLNIEKVIRQSVHPHDDILLRNLKDTEFTWSYLIYLQAVCKYLELKTKLQEIDEACIYARDSLLHYVDWMLDNEEPFLKNPKNLEYPNHTWTAQDLRKASIFYVASQYDEDKKDRYLETAQYYVQFVIDTLKNEDTRYFSRILILLMQNDFHEPALDYEATSTLRNAPSSHLYSSAPLHSILGIFGQFSRDMFVRLFSFSLKNEKRWLSFRMK